MSLFASHPRARWAVPVAAVALVGAGAVAVNGSATADTGLPPRTAAQLLVDVQQASVKGLSGTVVQTANLGLPQLPGLPGAPGGGRGSASLSAAVNGTNTWRVWLGGPTRSRLALLGSAGQSDIIRNGEQVVLWSSEDKTAVRYTLPDRSTTSTPKATPTDLPRTPEEAAQRALAAVDPTTEVTTSGTATVAGRPAYELALKPRDTASRVAEVRIAVDGTEGVPLRVQVRGDSSPDPALEVGFTSVDFSVPDARQFEFTAPPGTTVTDKGTLVGEKPDATNPPPSGTTRPKVVGTGWTAVVVAKLPAEATSGQSSGQAAEALAALPQVTGTWGSGRLLNGTLFSAVLTDDGRLAVGAVAPERLYAALATP